MTEAEKAQLWAIRNIVDALLMASTSAPAPVTADTCAHPETEDAGGTWGAPRRRCTQCKAIVDS